MLIIFSFEGWDTCWTEGFGFTLVQTKVCISIRQIFLGAQICSVNVMAIWLLHFDRSSVRQEISAWFVVLEEVLRALPKIFDSIVCIPSISTNVIELWTIIWPGKFHGRKDIFKLTIMLQQRSVWIIMTINIYSCSGHIILWYKVLDRWAVLYMGNLDLLDCI